MSEQVQASTALARVDSSEKIMSIIAGGEQSINAMQNIGKILANSRMLKLKNVEQGAAVVFASICENTNPLQLMREYHIMDDGGLSMRADAMLAKFNAAGGKHKWVKDGDDGQEAVLRLTFAGETTDVRYTIEHAKQAGLVRDKGNWTKNPGEMLRARCVSKGVRMVSPGIVAGIYCPEDFAEADAGNSDSATSAAPAATSGRRGRPPKTTNTPEAAAEGEIVDAEFQVTPDTKPADIKPAEEKPADPTKAAAARSQVVLMEIELNLSQLGKTKDELVATIHARNPAVNSLDDIPLEQAEKILENLRAAVAKLQKPEDDVPF